MQNSFRYLETMAVPIHPVHQPASIAFNPFTGYLILSLPIAISIILCLYLQWRSYLHDQQIKMLERIWQQDWNMPTGGTSGSQSNPL